jgi:hypothetical protein
VVWPAGAHPPAAWRRTTRDGIPLEEEAMKGRLAAALVGVAFAGTATTAILATAQVAGAETVSVCKREVYDELAGIWYCAEWSTCWYNPATGEWACDDGIYGGPPLPV